MGLFRGKMTNIKKIHRTERLRSSHGSQREGFLRIGEGRKLANEAYEQDNAISQKLQVRSIQREERMAKINNQRVRNNEGVGIAEAQQLLSENYKMSPYVMPPQNQSSHFLVVNEKDGDEKRGRSLLGYQRGNETQLLNDYSANVQALQTLKDEQRVSTNLTHVSPRVKRPEEGNDLIERPSSEGPDGAVPYL